MLTNLISSTNFHVLDYWKRKATRDYLKPWNTIAEKLASFCISTFLAYKQAWLLWERRLEAYTQKTNPYRHFQITHHEEKHY